MMFILFYNISMIPLQDFSLLWHNDNIKKYALYMPCLHLIWSRPMNTISRLNCLSAEGCKRFALAFDPGLFTEYSFLNTIGIMRRFLSRTFIDEFSTINPKMQPTLASTHDGMQVWLMQGLGSMLASPTLMSSIFKFSFFDASAPVKTAFCDELGNFGCMRQLFVCVMSQETINRHNLLATPLNVDRQTYVVSLECKER